MVRRKNGSEVDARIRALKADFDELQKDMRKLAESLGDAATNGVSEMAGSAHLWAIIHLPARAMLDVDDEPRAEAGLLARIPAWIADDARARDAIVARRVRMAVNP